MSRYVFKIDALERVEHFVEIEANSKEEALEKINRGEFPRRIDGDDDEIIMLYNYEYDHPMAFCQYLEPPEFIKEHE